jgi:hypothetical protein
LGTKEVNTEKNEEGFFKDNRKKRKVEKGVRG